VLGFALLSLENVLILKISQGMCLLHAEMFDDITPVRNFESHMQIAHRSVPWELALRSENAALQGTQSYEADT
jgi:hypothetical protein